ncbi:MAG: hypothetical protein BWY71_01233 [Planctomycetes bacterium ADurb.Bin412]|nr:MAG: hypothetical protein BWY71_01233 [Planctomycetes bacterium ADurb.Bin412]
MEAVRLGHHHHRLILQAGLGHVIQDTAVQHLAALGGPAEQGKSAAVKQFGEDIRQLGIVQRDAGAVGQAFDFVQVARVDKGAGPLPGIFDAARETGVIEAFTGGPGNQQNRADQLPHLVL